jgi:collagenase-like PrtC family protease
LIDGLGRRKAPELVAGESTEAVAAAKAAGKEGVLLVGIACGAGKVGTLEEEIQTLAP